MKGRGDPPFVYTLIFCDACEEQMIYLSRSLMWFEVVSGLKVSMTKSELFPIRRVPNGETPFFIGMQNGELTSYLGLTLGASVKL